jgi:hypothetical protein
MSIITMALSLADWHIYNIWIKKFQKRKYK